jgi:hypothetical protein
MADAKSWEHGKDETVHVALMHRPHTFHFVVNGINYMYRLLTGTIK